MISECLPKTETSSVDQERITELVAEMGPRAAERLVGRTMDEICELLVRAHSAYRESEIERLCDSVGPIAAKSQRIGLLKVAQVARDVIATATSGDSAAFAATFDRLLRITESGVLAIGDGWRRQV